MSSPVIATAIRMLESLPESAQEDAVEYLRAYIAEVQDERVWDARFKRTQAKLVAVAKGAKEQIAQGKAMPLDLGQL